MITPIKTVSGGICRRVAASEANINLSWLVFEGKPDAAVAAKTLPVASRRRAVAVGFLVFVFVGSFVGDGGWLAGVPRVEVDEAVLVFVVTVAVLVTAARFVSAGTPVLAAVIVGVLLG